MKIQPPTAVLHDCSSPTPQPLTAEMENRVRRLCDIAIEGDSMNVEGRALLAAMDYWKSRSPVRAEDVAALDIDYVKAAAVWTELNGDHPCDCHDDLEAWGYDMDDNERVAWMCNQAIDQWAALEAYARDCRR